MENFDNTHITPAVCAACSMQPMAHARKRDETAVLCVVIGTEGSTYQKTGALVLLDGKGLRHGVISGGCLEPALEQVARDVHASGRAALADFDTRSDEDLLPRLQRHRLRRSRAGARLCTAAAAEAAPFARALFAVLDQGVAVRLALATTGNEIGAGHATFAAKSTMSQSGFSWDARGFASADPVATTFDVTIASPPRLLLLGAGPETPPLALFARRLGLDYKSTMLEHRGSCWVAFARGAPIDYLIEPRPKPPPQASADEPADAIIAMSHNYPIDLVATCAICCAQRSRLCRPIGPARASRRPARGTLDADEMNSLKPRLHAPVGLDLGGHGPRPSRSQSSPSCNSTSRARMPRARVRARSRSCSRRATRRDSASRSNLPAASRQKPSCAALRASRSKPCLATPSSCSARRPILFLRGWRTCRYAAMVRRLATWHARFIAYRDCGIVCRMRWRVDRGLRPARADHSASDCPDCRMAHEPAACGRITLRRSSRRLRCCCRASGSRIYEIFTAISVRAICWRSGTRTSLPWRTRHWLSISTAPSTRSGSET